MASANVDAELDIPSSECGAGAGGGEAVPLYQGATQAVPVSGPP